MAKRDKITFVLPTGMNAQLKVLARQLGCSMSTLVGRICQERLEAANLWPPHNLNQPRRVLRQNPRSLFSPSQLGYEDKLPADAQEAAFIEESKRLARQLQQSPYYPMPDTRDCPGMGVAVTTNAALELTLANENVQAQSPLYFQRGK